MSAEDAEHPADEEIVDYEAEEAPADTAPVAETQQQTASPVAEAAATAADDAANADQAEAQADAQAAAESAGGSASGVKAATGGGDPLEEPPHGSEVFVGGIPKNATVTDEQLHEFASQGGEVYSCAVLKDPGSGLNRGYGFIKYKSKEIANAAMDKLNNTEMKDHPGHQIRVLPSQSKNRLYLGNLPKTMSKDELESAVRAATKGLESVELLMSKEIPGQNRGFCFLEFYNHACAQHAKAALSPPNFQVGNKPLTITFAEPRRADIAAEQQNEIKSIFVGNLPDTATEAKLREVFGSLGEITRAFIPAPRDGKTRREFGFVHYVDRASVLQAIKQNDEGDKFIMDGTPLDVKMGRVYHENPPPKFQQGGGFGQGGFGGRGMGMGMGGRFGSRAGFQQGGMMGGRLGGGGSMGMGTGYGGGYGMDDGYGGDDGYGYGGDEGFGGYGMGGGANFGMGGGGMGASMGAMAGGGGGGMQMVPMMLPNGQVGYVLSGAGGGMGAGMGGGGGMAAGMGGGSMGGGMGGMSGGMGGGGMGGGGMGMGGPMRGRGFGGGGAMRGRGPSGSAGYGGGGYGGRGGGGQRYAPY